MIEGLFRCRSDQSEARMVRCQLLRFPTATIQAPERGSCSLREFGVTQHKVALESLYAFVQQESRIDQRVRLFM